MARSRKKLAAKSIRRVPRKKPRRPVLSVIPRTVELTAGSLFWLGEDVYECASDTKQDVRYQLVVYPTGQIACQCPDFRKHRRRLCKHGKRVQALHDAFTNEQRALWPMRYDIPAKHLTPKNPVMASRHFYLHNVRRRELPFVRYADGRTMLAHRESVRCTWESRAFALLKDLLKAIESDCAQITRPYRFGRPGRSSVQRAFSVIVKVVEEKSIARAIQRIDRPVYQEILGNRLGKNSLYRYFQDPCVLAVLEQCLRLMATAVSPITTILNVDSSGFPTIVQSNYRRDDRGRNKVRPYTLYYRGHTASCAATNMIVAFIPSLFYGTDSSDYSQFAPLLRAASEVWVGFSHVLADKEYFSDEHINAVHDLRARFICPPKLGWRPEKAKHSFLARELDDLYSNRKKEFDNWYSWRGKIESVYSTIETLYGKAVWARGPYRQAKPRMAVPLPVHIELLAKCVAQNLSQLTFLEAVLEQEVSFSQNVLLHPFASDRVISGRTLLAPAA